MSSRPEQQLSSDGLVRGLGRWDATLLTVGSVIGTGIFITTADIARVLPNEGMILLIGNTLVGKPIEALIGLVFIAAGIPAYMWWRRHPAPDEG